MRRVKYRHPQLSGVFSDNVFPEANFTDVAVVKSDVPVVKLLL